MLRIIIRTAAQVEFREITEEVRQAVRTSGVQQGVCYVFVPHTTAGVIINERADPAVTEDIASSLAALVPQANYYRHAEGNTPAHVKSSLVGVSLVVFVENREVVLGTWQGIFLCEFDGPRNRSVWIKVITE